MAKGLMVFNLVVTYEDDQTDTVTVDQRDAAAFEMDDVMRKFGNFAHAIGREGHPTAAFRWVAWHALVRQKRTKLGWVKWSAEAVDVDFAPVESDDADPGEPTAAEGSSSE